MTVSCIANVRALTRMMHGRRESHVRKKGECNTRCGNKHPARAIAEAAHFPVRYGVAGPAQSDKESSVQWDGSSSDIRGCLKP